MTKARVSVAIGVVASAMLVFGVAAQEPVFRGNTRLVRLDVSVLDANKQPIRDLTAADFRVTERGRELTVRAFQIVEVPTTESLPGPAVGGGTAPAVRDPARTSEDPLGPTDLTASPGRLIVLLMDDGMTPTDPRWARQARDIARAIVNGMGSRDRIAMQFTRAVRTQLELTMDRSALLSQIEAFAPGGFLALPPTTRSWLDEEPRYWHTMSAIENTVESLASLTDRQKLIVYVGPGIPNDSFNLLMRARVALFRAANRANVVVYTFDPTGLDTIQGWVYERTLLGARMTPRPGPTRPLQSDLSASATTQARIVVEQMSDFSGSLADSTGGRALMRTDIFEPAVARMFADTSVYYLIAVDPPSTTPDGKFHEVTVKVTRPNVDVRARRGYYYDR